MSTACSETRRQVSSERKPLILVIKETRVYNFLGSETVYFKTLMYNICHPRDFLDSNLY